MNKRNKEIYLTFDMDWACNELMDFLYDLLEEYDLAATVHVTNYFDSLDRYKKNKSIELGIHPNFNMLVDGNSVEGFGDKKSIIEQCKTIVPDAVTARSHSLLSSTPVTMALYDYGIRYELNYYIEPYKGICVYPWFLQGVLQVPFFYEDDLYLMGKCKNSPAFYLDSEIRMYKIFNFHPIHLFLNSETLKRYERIKENYHNVFVLQKNANINSYGILDFFKELVKTAKMQGFQFGKITEIKEGINKGVK